MAVWEDVEAVNASTTLTPEEKVADRYRLKVGALVDILNNGKPAPGPLPPVVGQTFTFGDLTVTLHVAREEIRNGVLALHLVVTVVRDGVVILPASEDCYIVNPPIIASGGRRDLIEAAKEIIRNLCAGR